MSEDDEGGNRQSPLVYNGGVGIGPPAGRDDFQDEYSDAESRIAANDRGAGLPRRTSGAEWDRHRSHPPLNCPNPRIVPTFRGFYRCPGCAVKIRLDGARTGADRGEELAEAFWEYAAEGTRQAFWLLVSVFVDIWHGACWLYRVITRRPAPQDEIDPAQMVITLAMLGIMTQRYNRGSGADKDEKTRGSETISAAKGVVSEAKESVSQGN